MNTVVAANLVLLGSTAFALLHSLYLPRRERREHALPAFAAYCGVTAIVALAVIRLQLAPSVQDARHAQGFLTLSAVWMGPATVWLVSTLSGLRAPRLLAATVVATGIVASANAFGFAPGGNLWRVTVWAPLLVAYAFALVAGLHLRRSDRLAGTAVFVTALITKAATITFVALFATGRVLPLVANLVNALWIPTYLLVASRKRAHDSTRLETSEARYRHLVESAPEAIVIIDTRTNRYVDANGPAIDLLGWSKEELLARRLVTSDGHCQPGCGDGSDACEKAFKEALEGRVSVCDWIHRTKDGREIACEIRLAPLADVAEGLIRGTISDITDRKRTETALRNALLQQSAILESSLDGLILMDTSGAILEFNPAAEVIFGYQRKDVIGKDLADLLIPPSLRSAHRNGRERYLALGGEELPGRRVETPALKADGTELRLEVSVQFISQTDPPLFAGVVRDITARTQLEEHVRQTQKMEALGQLAGGVAHDFNNLLTVISAYGEALLHDLPPGASSRDDVKGILDAGRRAASLTSRLLTFSRHSVVAQRVIDVNAIIGDAEQILRPLIGEDIQLVVACDPGAGFVRGDADQLGQVLVNLIVNARDAMPDGGTITVATSQRELDPAAIYGTAERQPGTFVCLTVRDTGSGMTPETKSRLFEPFFSTKGVGKGTGLGLAVVYGIIERHHGHIAVESEPGLGTTFNIYLPCTVEARVPSDGHNESASAAGIETILLVEDEGSLRPLMARALSGSGFTVLAAADGFEALQILHDHTGHVDLLVTDVMMPNMNGPELADYVRAERPEIKILFVSGHADDTLLRFGALKEAGAFLQKPFTPHHLTSKVREILDERWPA